MRPLALAVKSSITHQLTRALVDTYLGGYSGKQILDGLVTRGDGGMIDCVLFYCDLRNSTKLSEQLQLSDYLELINTYFECTAGAVIDHGGEVLKFVGDAVMAIFPIDTEKRPTVDMCRAAMNSVAEAFDRAQKHNLAKSDDYPEIDFGVSLHVGQAMYGNVGIDRRLDFTVIGPAVNKVARLEGLCKQLNTRLVISDSFKDQYAGELECLGTYEVAGSHDKVDVYTSTDYR